MATYKWKKRPYRHQVAAVKASLRGLAKTGGFALLMEPRTGKTKTAIDVMSILHQQGKIGRVLIICPVGPMDVWIKEIRENCPYRHRIVVWDRMGRRYFNLPSWNANYLDFVIINYDAFSTAGAVVGKTEEGALIRSDRKGGRFDVRRAIRKWKPDMILLDESHRIKTPSSKKTMMIWSLAWKTKRDGTNIPLVPYRMILTGTVLTKKKRIFDIYSQWKFLNRDSPLVNGLSMEEFKHLYAVFTRRKGFDQWLRNKPKKEARLHKLLHEESFAVRRDECYDLPDRLPPEIIKVKLEESGPYYDQMAEEMVAMLEEGEITWAKIPLVQRLRLSQITSGIVKTEPTERFPNGRLVRIGREKLRMLEDLLIDLFEEEQKVVIPAAFRGDIAAIAALGAKMRVKVWELHGGVDKAQRTRNIEQFRKHEGAGMLVAQPSATAEGIDLSTAHTMIWFSLIDSWVQFQQFEDRIALSKAATRYVYLLADGTVDELKYQALVEDGEIAERITRSPRSLLRNFKD